jgi:hypothetical protein
MAMREEQPHQLGPRIRRWWTPQRVRPSSYSRCIFPLKFLTFSLCLCEDLVVELQREGYVWGSGG